MLAKCCIVGIGFFPAPCPAVSYSTEKQESLVATQSHMHIHYGESKDVVKTVELCMCSEQQEE